VFPGPFTLDAAVAVAGEAAESAVLHLVDCSLLTPPQPGPDGRPRYLMLETLRAFGRDLLADGGEQPAAAASLAGYAVRVAELAATGLNSNGGEMAAARWLDAEDIAVHQALTWALEHDSATALRLAVALAPWWPLRGRLVAGRALLHHAIERSGQHDHLWFAAMFRLGRLATIMGDYSAALVHLTAACEVLAAGAPSLELVDALAARSVVLRNLGRLPEATDDGRRALSLARQVGYPGGEAMALAHLSLAAAYGGDAEAALVGASQAQRIDPDPGYRRRIRHNGDRPGLTSAVGVRGNGAAQHPGAGAGHPGGRGPDRCTDRWAAIYQRQYCALAPGPDPG
jgi:tetratricopeptide (TPR) repeat protein